MPAGTPLSPPANLGVLGGGQLGRMFASAARTMGYRSVVLDPDAASPAGKIAHRHLCAPYEDTATLDTLCEHCDAITVEFENIPIQALEYLQERVAVSPSPAALAVAQDRIREKRFIRKAGIDTAAFEPLAACAATNAAVANANIAHDIGAAFERLSAVAAAPYLLKAARWGYDGKHQREVISPAEAEAAMADFGGNPCILEEKVALVCEVSVIVVRNRQGETRCYPLAENVHRNGILHTSTVPARADAATSEQLRKAAVTLAEALNYHGVLGVEFFIAADGRLLVNEIAPRPHNSGHYTLDACMVSQFEQQVRVMCGLPVGDTRLLSPVVMVNLLGDLWAGGEPDWSTLLSHPNLKLHLYGKSEARAGRKMGHFCMLGDDINQLLEQASSLHASLQHRDLTR